jgi:phosphoglycerate dehydrogenase-like enzyme
MEFQRGVFMLKTSGAYAIEVAAAAEVAADRAAESFQVLLSRIESKTATIGIIGLGYVGLPLARAFSTKGFPVLGFDIDAEKIDRLRTGESYIGHICGEVIQQMQKNGFAATDCPGEAR